MAAYSFDEGSGTTVTDASGNGNDGTVSNTTWSTAGKYGGALSFNGSNSIVTIPDSSSLDLTNSLTLEAWVKPSALGTAWRCVVFKEQTGDMVYSLYANEQTGTPVGQVYQGGEVNSPGTSSLPLNAWTFLAATYDGSSLKLYVNGTQAGSVAVSGALPVSNGALHIGGDSVWGEWFAGLIDNIRVYNVALSASQIQTDMNTAVGASTSTPVPSPTGAGPVAAYAFDEGSGTTAADSSGNGNTGTLTSTSWTTGKYGNALSFNGTSSWVTVPDAPSLDMTSAVTLEAWVDPTAFPSWSNLIAKERSGGFPYALDAYAADTGTPNAHVYTTLSDNVRAAATLPLNTWSFLTMAYDGTTLSVYVNGVLSSSTPASGAMPTSTGPLRIGGNSIHGDFFSGKIDNVRVYARALSLAEIQADMVTPVAGASAPPPPPSGDTQPPTAPSGLSVSSVTQSAISVAWNASTDNVGVAGYGLYENGTLIGSTTSTGATFSSLSCGTTYTLSVDAYDAAGNRSSKTSISASTSACTTSTASGNANIWVDTSGGSCTRQATPGPYNDTQACGSLDAAYAVANPGDVILIKGGTYPSQTINDRPSLATGTPVVFHPAPTQSVTINGDLVVWTHDITIDGGDVVGTDEPNRITVTGSLQAWMNSGQSDTRNIVFEDIHAASSFNTAHGVTIRYSEIGPNDECNSGNVDLIDFWPNAGTPVNINLLYNLIHTNNQNACLNNGDHADALQIYPAGGTVNNVVIRGNRWWWCATQCIFLGDGSYTNTVVENNMVEETDACGNCGPPMEVNFFSDNNVSSGDVFQYNTVEGNVQLPNNVPARGNVFLTPVACTGAVYSYNVFAASGGSTCGSNAKRCTPLLANGQYYSGDNNADWHISPLDTCARNAGDPSSYPPLDLDRQARPGSQGVDAGADQIP